MSIMRRVALPCGIAGGVWGILAPVVVVLPIGVRGTVSPDGGARGEEMVSLLEIGAALDALPFLGFISLVGVLGLLAIVLSRRRLHLGRIFIWVSASAMLVVSLLGIFSLGLFFLPASALLLVAAIGLKGEIVRQT